MGDYLEILYERASEEQSKFNYFMCGVAGSLFAYIAQTYTPQRLDNLYSYLQTCALILLASSFYCGIKRIQFAAKAIRLNSATRLSELNAENATAALKRGAKEGFSGINESVTGIPVTPEKLELRRTESLAAAAKCEKLIEEMNRKAKIQGWFQVNLLFLGFVLIFSAKVLQPYQSEISPRLGAIIQTTNKMPLSALEIQTNKPAKE